MPLHRRGALRVMAMAVAGSLYRIRYDGTQHRFRRYFLHGPRKGISECRLARTRILGHTIGRPPDTALAVQANCAIALKGYGPKTRSLGIIVTMYPYDFAGDNRSCASHAGVDEA